MTEWRVLRDGTPEPDLIDLTVVENADPMGDHGTAIIAAGSDGNRKNYQRGTPVTFQTREFDTSNSYSDQLTGYVVESQHANEAGGDVLEVEVYSLDTLLRRNTVDTDLSGQTISSAIKELIQDWTPVEYVAGNITVTDDRTIQRSFENERVDNVLRVFSRMSGFETYGVNSSREAFFEPAETGRADAIGPKDWIDYSLPDRGAGAANEAKVWYDDGERVVVVDDSEDKQALQSDLGTTDPVTFKRHAVREEGRNFDDARAVGREVLSDRADVLQIEVTTFGHRDASPGDTIEISIPQADLRDEFRIAQLEYELSDRVTITAINDSAADMKARDVHADMLVRHSDTLERVELRNTRSESGSAATDEPLSSTRVIETDATALIEPETKAGTLTHESATLTNDGFEALLDAWINDNPLTVDKVVVGDGDAPAARADSSLENQLDSANASVATGSGLVTIEGGPITASNDFTEVGVQLSNGTLFSRHVLTGSTNSVSVFFSYEFKDGSGPNDVFTDVAQDYARDLVAGNSASGSSDIASGTGSPTIAESTTSLDNRVDTRDVGAATLRQASDQQTFERLIGNDDTTGFSDTVDDNPMVLDNGDLELAQTAKVKDGQDQSDVQIATNSDFTGGEAAAFAGTAFDRVKLQWTPGYDIPKSKLKVAVRAKDRSGGGDTLQVDVGGGQSKTLDVSTTLEWESFDVIQSEFRAGEPINVELLGNGTTDVSDTVVDVVVVYDDRFYGDQSFGPGSWDNNNGGSSGYLDDPPLYPQDVSFPLVDYATDSNGNRTYLGELQLGRAVDSVTVNGTFDDTSNNQAIIIEGNTNSNTSSATESISLTDTLTDTKIQLGNYGSQTGSTPLQGTKGQVLKDVTVSSSTGGIKRSGSRQLDVRADIPPDEVDGKKLTESALRDGNGDTQTVHGFADVLVDAGQTVALRESIKWRMSDAARPVNESRMEVEITDESQIVAGDVDSTDNLQVAIRRARGV